MKPKMNVKGIDLNPSESTGFFLAEHGRDKKWEITSFDGSPEDMQEYLNMVETNYADYFNPSAPYANLWDYGYLVDNGEYYVQYEWLHMRIFSTRINEYGLPLHIDQQPSDLIDAFGGKQMNPTPAPTIPEKEIKPITKRGQQKE